MGQEKMEQIFLEHFRMYGDAIFRFLMVKVTNRELAEDYTQEVFMRYWQSLREGKEMTNTRAYLYTIAHNLAKDWYRKKKADSLDAKMDTGFEPVSSDANPLLDASYTEVLAVIEDLEENDREVLMLRFIEGLDPKDIAEIIDESANVVSVRLNRAMKRLKEKLHV
jgi:RNA polymerase sigma-70 factor (ECF subfamily)